VSGGAIRRARPDEAAALTDLALRSKAHWGYDVAFMAACRDELTMTPEIVAAKPVFVFEAQSKIRGFYALEVHAMDADVSFLFVEPAAMGRGVGKVLWRHLTGEAKRLGAARITIESDPDAEGFYQAMGARTVGEAPSGSIPGRTLPLLEVALDPPTV
jgi:GNAT superfamily N-acetyltransferase